jgi:hypothetical protein
MPGTLQPTLYELGRTASAPTDLDFSTQLQLAIAMCAADEFIMVHDEHCPVTPEDPDACRCEAQIYAPSPRVNA